jgi:hypothetical protein
MQRLFRHQQPPFELRIRSVLDFYPLVSWDPRWQQQRKTEPALTGADHSGLKLSLGISALELGGHNI